MSLSHIFKLVAWGRIQQEGKDFWICPLCAARFGPASSTARDRLALDHCLAHADASPGTDASSPHHVTDHGQERQPSPNTACAA